MVTKQITRRTFIKIAASCLLAASSTGCTHKKFFNPDEDIILSGGSYTKNNAVHYALIVINLTRQEKRVIDTAFMPHDILISPNNKYRIYCFEKNGTNACEVDLRRKIVIRKFLSTEGRFFSGHAAFSQHGNQLYCIENAISDDAGKRFGHVVIRDTETLAPTKQLLTYGLSAHDCQLLENQTLVVSNTGQSTSNQRPSLVYLDLDTERVINRLHATHDNRQHKLNHGHFEIGEENDLVIASAPLSVKANKLHSKQAGGVSIKKHNESLITMSEPDIVIKRMTGEALSISINQHHKTVAITHPDANLLTFWSLDRKQIIKAYGIENPRGISQTLNGKNFIVSYGNKAAMAQISINDLTPVSDSIVSPTHASGEHIVNWSKNLRKIMPKEVYL